MKQRKKMSNSRSVTRWVMGKNCLLELLNRAPQRIIKILLSAKDEELKAQIQRAGLTFSEVNKKELSDLLNSDSHQGVAASIKEKKQPALNDYLEESFEKERDLILVFDSINDPQNLGTLMRAAECFGVGAVMWSKNRGVDITPVVAKTSVGASELVTVIRVSNLSESIKRCKKEGYEVITAEVGKEAKSLNDFTFPKKSMIIMGSEGKGVRELLSKQADHKLYIPMKGQIDSLNVSQATSVFLYQWQSKTIS